MGATLTLMTALVLCPGQDGGPQIVNERVTHGILGPPRAEKTFLPGDIYFLSFDVEGLKSDNGRMQYSMRMELLDREGKPRFSSTPEARDVFDVLGAGRVPAFAHAVIGVDSDPGDYTLRLTLTDLATGKARTLTRTFTVGRTDFGLVGVQLTYDGRLPAPPVFVVGQPLLLQAGVVGFTRDEKTRQPRVRVELRVTDDAGKPTLASPAADVISKNVDERVALLPAPVEFATLRAGRFTVELIATDVLTKKTASVALPLTVLDTPAK